jgi:hypothetical protein
MTDTTDRLGLPLLAAGQAQKELWHNEALALIDARIAPEAETVGADAPPAEPGRGQCWITGAAPIADWEGRPETLACWTGSGWRFAAPRAGTAVWSRADGCWALYDGAGWLLGTVPAKRVTVNGHQVLGPRRADIDVPANGAVVDTEARTSITEIIEALRAHGLIGA